MTRKLEVKAAARLVKEAFLRANVRISHTEALDLLAQLEGFEAWSHLHQAVGKKPAGSAENTFSFAQLLREEFGHWHVFSRFPLRDWQAAVDNGDTRQGYHDWMLTDYLVDEIPELADTAFRYPKDICVRVMQGLSDAWPLELNLTDRWGALNFADLQDKPGICQLLLEPQVLEEMQNLLVGEDTIVVRWGKKHYGLLYEHEYLSKDSDDVAEGARCPQEYEAVVRKLLAAIPRLREAFPKVFFGVPPKELVYKHRPAIWAFMTKELAQELGEKRREELAVRLGTL